MSETTGIQRFEAVVTRRSAEVGTDIKYDAVVTEDNVILSVENRSPERNFSPGYIVRAASLWSPCTITVVGEQTFLFVNEAEDTTECGQTTPLVPPTPSNPPDQTSGTPS